MNTKQNMPPNGEKSQLVMRTAFNNYILILATEKGDTLFKKSTCGIFNQ